MKVGLFIFDMDGLMFDTGRLAYRAYLKSAAKGDYQMTHQVYYYLTGRNNAAILAAMAELYGEDVPYEKWRQKMNDYKEEIFQTEGRVYKKKGLVELLHFAHENQIQVAVASSNVFETISAYLKAEEIVDLVDFVISGDQVTAGKPDPEIFLTACQKAGVNPAEAIVFEDSAAGIEAANSGKIPSVLVPDDISDLPEYQGKYPLIKAVPLKKVGEIKPTWQFTDLKAAKDFLEKVIE